jgi:hypothetical protein
VIRMPLAVRPQSWLVVVYADESPFMVRVDHPRDWRRLWQLLATHPRWAKPLYFLRIMWALQGKPL